MLQWIEAISTSKTLDPSPMLLHTMEGAVIHTGYMECQEFAHEPQSMGISPHRPMMSRNKLGTMADMTGTFAAVDYGKHWTVLRSSGLVQCLVDGKPETIFNLAECRKIKVHNPKEMKEGSDYCFEVDSADSRFILKAELPTDHFDWVIAIEEILKQLHREKLLMGHRKRESSYIALKRLLLSEGQRGGSSSQLYCLPRAFDDMEDIYDPPKIMNPPPPKTEHKRSQLLRPSTEGEVGGKLNEDKENIIPLPPKDYLPPPLPPRNDAPPPLPPKGRTLSSRKSPPTSLPMDIRPSSVASTASGQSDPDNDYVMMQSSQALSSGSQTPTTPYGSLGRSSITSQPITIPNRRTTASKRSALLRQDSESSSIATSPPNVGNSLHDLHEGVEMPSPLHSHGGYSVSSSTHSLHRQNSLTSLGSSYGRQQGFTSPLSTRDREFSSGYNSPLLGMSPSPGLRRSQSHCHRMNGTGTSKRLPMTMNGSQSTTGGQANEPSKSDGMMVSEVQNHFYQQRRQTCTSNGRQHPISIPHTWSMESDGYGSSSSSTEDLTQVYMGVYTHVYLDTVCDRNILWTFNITRLGHVMHA